MPLCVAKARVVDDIVIDARAMPGKVGRYAVRYDFSRVYDSGAEGRKERPAGPCVWQVGRYVQRCVGICVVVGQGALIRWQQVHRHV